MVEHSTFEISKEEWDKLSAGDKLTFLLNRKDVHDYLWKVSLNIHLKLQRNGINTALLDPEDIYQEIVLRLFQSIKNMQNFDPRKVLANISFQANWYYKRYFADPRKDLLVNNIHSYEDSPHAFKVYRKPLSEWERLQLRLVQKVFEELFPGEEFDPIWLTSKEAKGRVREVRKKVRRMAV